MVRKDNALDIRRRSHNDAHRKTINGARLNDWERPNRRKFRQQDQELPENMSKTVTSFFLDFIFIPRLRIYPLVVPGQTCGENTLTRN